MVLSAVSWTYQMGLVFPLFSRQKKKALTFARKCLIFSVGHLGLDCETDEDPEAGPNNRR